MKVFDLQGIPGTAVELNEEMTTYRLVLPEYFDDDAWEIECKGWLYQVPVEVGEVEIQLTFYDPGRLAQDVSLEIETTGSYFERNIVVVPAVTRAEIEKAVEQLWSTKVLQELAREHKKVQTTAE